ncbi:MAG: flavoprotein [Alphaproteobacteria bacterium]|nr:flavoprotein [Alphaproteobacteria bacterium]
MKNVAIVGAGPIGLAAGANLLERGIPFTILEAGETAASSVKAWGHVALFSPWRHLIDPASRRLLEANGWHEPAGLDRAPTGDQLVELYLEPLAALLAEHVRVNARVTAISRRGMDRTRSTHRAETPFIVRSSDADIEASAVIDASGTYLSPNSLASNGLEPRGLDSVAGLISPALPDVLGSDRHRFSGKRVVVAGAGHSAATTLLALVDLKRLDPATSVSWVIRNATAVRVFTPESDELPDRAGLGSRLRAAVEGGEIELVPEFEIESFERRGERAIIHSATRSLEADVIVSATGFRPDLSLEREIRLDLDEVVEAPRKLAPLIDPNVHSCGTVEPHGFAELQHPEPDFFIAGMKSYGRAPTFLLATGYEQVRSIAAHLAGDEAAARAVELTLPATGACSTNAPQPVLIGVGAGTSAPAQSSCCS